MWCGNAAGRMLPPMVVDRTKNLYSGWATGGIAVSIYSAIESGLFDSDTFIYGSKNTLCHFQTRQLQIKRNYYLEITLLCISIWKQWS